MIEVAWIFLATLGVVVSAVGVKHAHDGVRSPLNQHNGSRVVARGYRRGEALALVKQLVLLGLGIGPALDPTPVRLSPFVVALFAINLLGLVRSALELRDRNRLRQMRLEEDEQRDP